MRQLVKSTLQSAPRWIAGNIGWELLVKIFGGILSLESVWAFGVSHLRTSVWNILNTSPSTWSVVDKAIVAELSVTLLAACFLIGYRQRAKPKRKHIYDFVEVEQFAWRYAVSSGQLDDPPYCPVHHLPLTEIGNVPKLKPDEIALCCFSCSKPYVLWRSNLDLWRKLAKERAHAVVFGYLRDNK